MLSPTDRDWLNQQKTAMLAATSRAYIYSSALSSYVEQRRRSWRPLKRLRRNREVQRLDRLEAIWTREVNRRAAVINAWVQAYRITDGPDRGPIDRTAKRPIDPFSARMRKVPHPSGDDGADGTAWDPQEGAVA